MLNEQINDLNNVINTLSEFKHYLEYYNDKSIQNMDYSLQKTCKNFEEITKWIVKILNMTISCEYEILTYIKRGLNSSYIEESSKYATLMNNLIVLHGKINKLYSEEMSVSEFRKLKTEMEYNSYPASIADTDGNTVIVHLPYLPKKKVILRDYIIDDVMVNLLDKLILIKEIPKMTEKIIRIVNVFPTSTKPQQIPDNDKYNLRNIIDDISDYTSGNDNGLLCKILVESFITDELYEGSYIIAEPCLPETPLNKSSLDIIKGYKVFTKI